MVAGNCRATRSVDTMLPEIPVSRWYVMMLITSAVSVRLTIEAANAALFGASMVKGSGLCTLPPLSAPSTILYVGVVSKPEMLDSSGVAWTVAAMLKDSTAEESADHGLRGCVDDCVYVLFARVCL